MSKEENYQSLVETLPENENRIISVDTLLKVGERYYRVQPLLNTLFSIEETNEKGPILLECDTSDYISIINPAYQFTPDEEFVYLYGDFYYPIRGDEDDDIPGIYYDKEKEYYFLSHPVTDKEIEEYKYADKIVRRDVDEIRQSVLNHEVIIFNIPDASHTTLPDEGTDDDILKRIIKRAVAAKGIDLDQYKTRFASKNMLFNTKQVLRGPKKVSMLIFDRCAQAFNLKYTIIVEEAGGETIGYSLPNKIVISSDEVSDGSLGYDDGE